MDLIENVDNARFFITTLKDLGCSVAIEDTGFGASSLDLLKRLPIDYLTINSILVQNMAFKLCTS